LTDDELLVLLTDFVSDPVECIRVERRRWNVLPCDLRAMSGVGLGELESSGQSFLRRNICPEPSLRKSSLKMGEVKKNLSPPAG
jgi:hypothetical protein